MSASGSPVDLPFERSFYIGNILGGIFYGLQIYTSFHSVHLTLNSSSNQRMKVFYIGYGLLMLLCMSFSMIANSLLGQELWIEHRNDPGGPIAYWNNHSDLATWYAVLGSAANMFGNFMGDALLLYRLYVFFAGRWYIVVVPFVVFLTSSTLAIVSIIKSVRLPTYVLHGHWQSKVAIYFVPCILLSCLLNAMITILITARLYLARREIRKIMPENIALKVPYTGVIAILVESALPFTLLGIAYAVILITKSPWGVVFSLIWSYYLGLAPQLIILRVAMGRAWSKDTSAQLMTSIQFVQSNVGVSDVEELNSRSSATV
ncbi:hypothetical protein GGU11DRAFT_674725 [Lentinula aff. detonsa]|uniref:Uncharacterized protein n=1 Tax=Lentinula aff. detonsa TaxID=2804958 RepID=A0AA38NU74_9AGAR|nr:hypothetical protein GGU10DRAFT_301593 [Lentinula aff. detonsa]KAJ3801549.1 hypothetical protein GGU11DRAFT_674725 [Lentinula aff. detonsa]